MIVLLCPLAAWGQTGQELAEGRALYRSNCAFCHGLTGAGGRGPALVGRTLLHGSTREDLQRVITNGVPGTNMPAFEMESQELEELVRYLRRLSGKEAQTTVVPGDRVRGRQVYLRTGCAGCHRIGDEGSDFGPELTRVGAGRSADYIRQSLLEPSADVPPEYEGVTVVARDGKRITGIRVNEDTFSVQLRDASQEFRMCFKNEVQQVLHETKSLMPAYQSLPSKDLTDLLAYLDSLRGQVRSGVDAKKQEGIR